MRSTFKVLFYLKKDKHKVQPVVPVMGRITVNGTIAQFSAKLSVPPHLWEVKGGRAKGKSLEADRINRHPDNIRIRIGKHCRFICNPDFTSEADSSCYMVKIIEKKSFNARRNLITACWSCLSTFFCGMPNCSAISL